MGQTATQALPYPEGGAQPLVHLDIKALADAVDVVMAKGVGRGELGYTDQAGTTASNASITTRLAVMGRAFTIATARKVLVMVNIETATGVTGGELGRIELRNGASVVRRAQWSVAAGGGGAGEVTVQLLHRVSLAAGTYSFTVDLLRVTGGTSVSVAGSQMVILDMGAA